MSKERVLMAMSGGIDSTMSAILLLEQGYELVGITFRSWDETTINTTIPEIGCCASDAVAEAKKIAQKLGFEHHEYNICELFKNEVIDNFINEYLKGRTPNPCVTCNKHIKWGALLNKADEYDCRYIATGHYAQIGTYNGHHYIKKGADTTKDQSYFLWRLTKENLSRTLFPLGGYTKQEVRQMAAARGFVELSQKSESQEICFVANNNYRDFLHNNSKEYNSIPQGNFISTDGKILGKHKGFPNYTIGQRKGLEIALGKPMYVTKIDAINNTVTLGNKEDLLSNKLEASEYNFTKIAPPYEPIEVLTRVRYRSQGGMAQIQIVDNRVKVVFKNPIDAITPGQSVVFYQDNDMIGGGIID